MTGRNGAGTGTAAATAAVGTSRRVVASVSPATRYQSYWTIRSWQN